MQLSFSKLCGAGGTKKTDKEIIKALEEWGKEIKDDYRRLKLLDAPMDCFEESHIDKFLVLSNAFDLINRQKAEIERLKKSRDRWRQIAEEFDKITRENEKAGETE